MVVMPLALAGGCRGGGGSTAWVSEALVSAEDQETGDRPESSDESGILPLCPQPSRRHRAPVFSARSAFPDTSCCLGHGRVGEALPESSPVLRLARGCAGQLVDEALPPVGAVSR
jgi:hypothetical protein